MKYLVFNDMDNCCSYVRVILCGIFDTKEDAEKFIQKQDKPEWYRIYSFDGSETMLFAKQCDPELMDLYEDFEEDLYE